MSPSKLRTFGPLLLLRTTHPRTLLATAFGVAAAAALAGRPAREVGLVLATVVVGQAVLGWHNDLTDRKRDLAHFDEDHPPLGKPIAASLLDPGTAGFALACGILLLVPLSISAGVIAGCSFLAYVLVGLVSNRLLRRGALSWLLWAVSYALLPAYLAYGGWGGEGPDTPPEISVTVLAAVLGVCVHVLVSLPGLVLDHEDGWRSLPLRVALRLGAPRLLWAASVITVLVVVGLCVAGTRVGLTQ